jgi:hypothetical protein
VIMSGPMPPAVGGPSDRGRHESCAPEEQPGGLKRFYSERMTGLVRRIERPPKWVRQSIGSIVFILVFIAAAVVSKWVMLAVAVLGAILLGFLVIVRKERW